ncbi:MAG: hypothetical protein KDJ50_01675 [Alphaproteobacteria bacterium]|nr:hypothetical protein [Alphaproteobacteria bacterium]
MMSLFISTSSVIEVGKLFLLVALSYMLFEVTTKDRKLNVYHYFNLLFAISMIVFVVYALLFRGDLYGQVRSEYFLVSLVGLAVAMIYTPAKKMVLPPRPVEVAPAAPKRVVRKVKKTTKKVAKKVATKKVAAKKAPKKTVPKKAAPKKAVSKKAVSKKASAKKSALKKKRA